MKKFQHKMPCLDSNAISRMPMILLKDDSRNEVRYIEWITRCEVERRLKLKPHASPALKT